MNKPSDRCRTNYNRNRDGTIAITDRDRFETALEIVARWGLSDGEMHVLLAVSAQTFRRWESTRPRLGLDQRVRISNLANIDIALEAVFNDEPTAIEWLRRPNANFGERSPLAVMLEGGSAGILTVRTYIERLL